MGAPGGTRLVPRHLSKRQNTGSTPLAKVSKPAPTITRKSAAEYLPFIAAAGQGGFDALYTDENIWLTRRMMALCHHVNVRTIGEHLRMIIAARELQEDSVIWNFRITATEGNSDDSCSPSGRITLNPLLAKAPGECID